MRFALVFGYLVNIYFIDLAESLTQLLLFACFQIFPTEEIV